MSNTTTKDFLTADPKAPIICIDGPAGVGKGTISQQLALQLQWHILDSGALYRIVGLMAVRRGIDLNAKAQLADLARSLDIRFIPDTTSDHSSPATSIMVDGDEVTHDIRTESCGDYASAVAQYPAVREALVAQQHSFQQMPGLVADGRDMGTTIFPDAPCKIFLTASAEIRAERRHKQLKEQGINANLRDLFEEIQQRDYRDQNRANSPLIPAEDALEIDTSTLNIDQVMAAVLSHVQNKIADLPLSTY